MLAANCRSSSVALTGLAILGYAFLILSPSLNLHHEQMWLFESPHLKNTISNKTFQQLNQQPVGSTSPPPFPKADAMPAAQLNERFRPFFVQSEYDAASCISNCLARNQPQLKVNDTALPLPPCTERQAWCKDAYSSGKIKEACEILCKNQYPANCSSAKYLVMIGEWPWGYGSHLHSIMLALTWTLSVNRVLIFENFNSSWTIPNDSVAMCAQGNAMCYYRPITNCTLPSGWRSTAQALQPRGPEQHNVQRLYFWFYRYFYALWMALRI